MTTSNNTISKFTKDQSTELATAIEVLNGLTKGLTDNDLNLTLTLKNKEGVESELNMPNFFSQAAEIKRIDQNYMALAGLDGGSAVVQQADGTYKTIYSAKRDSTPEPIKDLKVPVEFNRKNNWFFENFLSPLLYVKFNLSDEISEDIRKVKVKRIILNIENDTQLDIFNSNLSGRNDLGYEDLILFLTQNGITFFIDDDTYDIPPSILRYEGTFGVISTFDSIDEATGNKIRYYKLSNVTYTDNLSPIQGTKTLSSGDIISISDSTKYEVQTVDVASRNITVKKISGKDSIKIGDNVFKIESKKYSTREINVNVGYDEKQIIFVTPINTQTNITSTKLSNGVCFDSNRLTIRKANGETVTLEEYYQKEVTDFGMHIMNLSKEKNIPTIFGKIPSAPNVTTDNFKVVQINDHLQQDTLTKEIKAKIADKTRLKKEVENLDIELRNLSTKIQSSRIGSQERAQLESQIDEVNRKLKNKISEYNAVLTSLNLIYKENPKDRIKPKYRVRGFWELPTPQEDSRTGKQEVVQFNIQYRYLSRNGNLASAQQLAYSENGESTSGYFSNWNQIQTKPRKKYYSLTEDKFVWDEENTDEKEEINTNQLDIPIQPGEQVEIKIQSVSEAGYPSNPLVSNFSETVKIEFPEELNAEIDLFSVLEEAAREEERSIIYKEIRNYGFERHFRNSGVEDSVYYAHGGNEIKSGIVDVNGDILSVTQVLKNLQSQIDSLKGDISTQTPVEVRNGKLSVFIDGKNESGQFVSYPVENGGVVELRPPSYYNAVSKLSVGERRGAIIKEEYTLVLQNTGDGPLHLNSKYPGATYEGLPELTGSNLTWRDTSFTDDIYKTLRRYDKVPVKYKNFSSYEDIKDDAIRFGYGHQQSSQVAGQFIYNRYKDIRGTKTLYSEGEALQPKYLGVDPSTFGNKKSFLWDGNWYNPVYDTPANELNPYTMAPTGNGALSDFSVHVGHTDLKENRKTLSDLLIDSVLTRENLLEHAKWFNVEKGTSNHYKQSELTKNSYGKFLKFGFYENDRYLIGENTTGMYFYMNPDTPESVRVLGQDATSVRVLEPGQRIEIPLMIEYRLSDYYSDSDSYTTNQKLTADPIDISEISSQLKLNTSSVPALQLNSKNIVASKQTLGVVGGYSTSNKNRKDVNISYEKILGFDISSKNNPLFSFDVKAVASFGSTKNYISIDGGSTAGDVDRLRPDLGAILNLDQSLFPNNNNNKLI